MASRPKRGKYMPIPPPRAQHDSDSDSSEESESSESSLRSTNEEVDTALVEGEVIAMARLQKLQQQQQLLQQQQQQQQEEEEEDGDEEEEEEDEDMEEEEDEEEGGGAEEDGGFEEEEEEDFRPPPTPRVAVDRRREMMDREDTPIDIREPQDFGKIYTELIDTCHNLEADTGFDENFQHVMSKNIQKGHALFEHLMKGTMGQSGNEYGSKRTIGGPGDMYLAFLHTQISSNIIRSRAERIGSGASIFSVDNLLDSLKKEFVDGDGDYNAKLAAANIAMQTSIGTKTLMPLVAVVGTFDRDAVIVPKAKKPRVPIRRPNAEEQQDNAVDDNTDNMQLVPQNPGAENLAKEMNKILKYVYRNKPEPVNLFEFVMDRQSFPKTVENIFYLSFLVKDGHVSITKEENGKFKDLSLVIKPEKSQKLETSSPDEGETSRNQTHRQKYILSFSPRMWKSMTNMSEGEDFISYYQQIMDSQLPPDKRALPALKYK